MYSSLKFLLVIPRILSSHCLQGGQCLYLFFFVSMGIFCKLDQANFYLKFSFSYFVGFGLRQNLAQFFCFSSFSCNNKVFIEKYIYIYIYFFFLFFFFLFCSSKGFLFLGAPSLYMEGRLIVLRRDLQHINTRQMHILSF